MAMPATQESVLAALELRDVLDLVRHREDLRKIVEVLIESGMPEATAYRRLKQLGELRLDELRAISYRFDIPVEVLVAGPRSTMRWMIDNPPHDPHGPAAPSPIDGGSVTGESSSACTRLAPVLPLRPRDLDPAC